MAETRPSATVKSATSVQPKKSSNVISWIAPVACLIIGFFIWRFVMGADSNFERPDAAGGFWPKHEGPKSGFAKMYEGGVIVPVLISCFLIVLTFTIERLLTISKATGKGNIAEFIRKVQYHLANRN